MRYLGAAVVFMFALGTGFSHGAVVSAGALSASDEITITARVADAHYVVVDSRDNILEITSNTVQPVTPRVFRGSITDTSEIPLSKGIYEQYRKLTRSNQGMAGTLYKKDTRIGNFDSNSHLLLFKGGGLSIIRYLR